MVIVPDKFVFLATPRTASRAITEALLKKYPNAISEYPRNHHDPAPDTNELPVYTVIRNPYDQLLSWYSHVVMKRDPKNRQSVFEFASTYENPMFFPKYNKYRLNIHAEQADKFIPYTSTLNKIAYFFELKDLERVGSKNTYKPTDREERDLWRILDRHFASDLKLWVNRSV